VSRELQLAGVLEAAAASLRCGQGWDEGATGDVLREMVILSKIEAASLAYCLRSRG
jgi:hypothetical protein